MTRKQWLASVLTKLLLVWILLIIFSAASFAPAARATTCALEQPYFALCPTGTGARAVTRDDVMRFLNSHPMLSHHTGLEQLVAITEFKYLPLGDTNYFQGMSGNTLPSGTTLVISVHILGIFDFYPLRGPVRTSYGQASLLIDARTGDMFSAEIGPVQ